MPVLDHLILPVNDREKSVRFYTEVLGFEDEGERGPFVQVRVSPDCAILLAVDEPENGQHAVYRLRGNLRMAVAVVLHLRRGDEELGGTRRLRRPMIRSIAATISAS